MELPLILVNFKCYVAGKKAFELAKKCEKIARKYKIRIAVAPQFVDIKEIANLKIQTFAQHMDAIEEGAFTGHISAKALKEAGAKGVIINHSERKLSLKEIESCVKIAKKFKLITVCCAESLEEGKRIAKLEPDFLAYEDPFLIGSGRAISRVKPESVKKFVEDIGKLEPKVKVLCGAGISSGLDVKKALELGTVGVLVSSSVVKAKDPKKILEEFAKAIEIETKFI
ncbi:MAG: triose-phosphate isomerase [Candidatus Aenigmatarchaeota archaeon]